LGRRLTADEALKLLLISGMPSANALSIAAQ